MMEITGWEVMATKDQPEMLGLTLHIKDQGSLVLQLPRRIAPRLAETLTVMGASRTDMTALEDDENG